jgi:hypothetical protein
MAQTGYTPILTYSSSTAAATPTAGSLTNSTLGSELAINITDGKLFYKDNANAVQVIGWKVVPATAGGTGQTSYAVGDILYADTTTSLAKLPDVAIGNALISGGVGVAPAWGKIGLTTHVTGTLPVANGGTGTATAFTTGSVVFAGASGVYSQDNANFFWDDSNNRLGIGTTSPQSALSFASGSVIGIATVDGSDNGVLAIAGGGTAASTRGGFIEVRGNEATTAGLVDITSGNVANSHVSIQGRSSSSYIRFLTNATEAMRIFSSQGVSIGNTTDPGATNLSVTGLTSAARFVPTGSTVPTNGMYLPAANTVGVASNSTLVLSVLKGSSVALEGATTQTGVGITFPAAQVASTNANTLDDYEEGTFSPVVRDNNGGNQATATTTVARYIKIGKMVYFDITFLDIVTTGLTAANQIVITGLPFTSENTANTGPMVQVGRANVTATTGAVFGGVVPNATHMTLLNATTTGLAILPVSTITSGTGDLYLTGNYITSA